MSIQSSSSELSSEKNKNNFKVNIPWYINWKQFPVNIPWYINWGGILTGKLRYSFISLDAVNKNHLKQNITNKVIEK